LANAGIQRVTRIPGLAQGPLLPLPGWQNPHTGAEGIMSNHLAKAELVQHLGHGVWPHAMGQIIKIDITGLDNGVVQINPTMAPTLPVPIATPLPANLVITGIPNFVLPAGLVGVQ